MRKANSITSDLIRDPLTNGYIYIYIPASNDKLDGREMRLVISADVISEQAAFTVKNTVDWLSMIGIWRIL